MPTVTEIRIKQQAIADWLLVGARWNDRCYYLRNEGKKLVVLCDLFREYHGKRRLVLKQGQIVTPCQLEQTGYKSWYVRLDEAAYSWSLSDFAPFVPV